MRIEYLLAWLLPLFAGTGLCALFAARIDWRRDAAMLLGAGWLAGALLAALLTRLCGRDDTVHAFAAAAPWLAGTGVVAWVVAAVVQVRSRASAGPGGAADAHPQRWVRVAWWLLLALVALRFVLLAWEASLRPVFPWDAWSAWALKSKAWMLLGHAEPFVSMHEWLADPAAATRTVPTWFYPELLPWLQVWFASAAGGWNEPLVNLAWSGALAALALALYGSSRTFGLPPLCALLLTYLFVSLPLLDAHVALAGYADLWIAAVLGMAVFAWARWLALRQHGQWWLALAFAACLPAIKLEGAVWLVLFLIAALLERLPVRLRWKIALGACIAVAVAIVVGIRVPVPALGWIELSWNRIALADWQVYELGWHPVGDALLASLFTLPNWHLLWFALPVLVCLRAPRLRDDAAARSTGWLLLLQLLFLFALFFLTGVSTWAQDYTSANRLILQMVPCVFAFAALLLRPLSDDAAGAPIG